MKFQLWEKALLVIVAILIAHLLIKSTKAEGLSYDLLQYTNDWGQSMIYFVNYEQFSMYCSVEINRRFYKGYRVEGLSSSPPFPEPKRDYTYECE